MATGTAFGGVCYSTQAEAATMFCSGVAGVASAGVVSCAGLVSAPSSVSGGAVVIAYTLRTASSSGSLDAEAATQLQPCETYGLDFWSPAIGAWVAAALAIVAAKMAYRRIFDDRATY